MENNLTLTQAIEALNNGHKVTHEKYDDKYFTKTSWCEARHSIEQGVDPMTPLENIYYRETLSVAVYNSTGFMGELYTYQWKNDDSRRNFPLDGWRIKI